MRDPKNILITGASSGLGAALALAYAAPGVQLFLHGRKKEALDSLCAQTRTLGARAESHVGDVTDAQDMAEWIKACDALASLDLVIASAGVSEATLGGKGRDSQAHTLFATNVSGVFHTVHPILPTMRRRRRGQIALLSSLASFRGFAGAAAYCGSKAAIRLYGEALRVEMAPYNVQVNVICPGFVKTPMTDGNPFPMPFKISAERAAEIMREGLAANGGRIAFPWQMYVWIRFFAGLPQPVVEFIARFLPTRG